VSETEPADGPDLTGKVRQAISWGHWLCRWLVAAVAAHACLVLLQCLGLIPYLAIEPSDRTAPKLWLDPIPDALNHAELTVTGWAQPYSMLMVGINERPIVSTYSDSTGHFKTPLIVVPPQASRLWVRARTQRGEQSVEKPIRFAWDAAVHTPILGIAIYISDIGQLWVTGQTTPGVRLRLETESGDALEERLYADGIGIFDRFVPLPSEPQGQIVARAIGNNQSLRSAPVPITSLPLTDLPLARTVDIHLASDKTTLAMEILLPAAHPYFRALAQGYMSAGAFTRASFGILHPTPTSLMPTLTIRSADGLVRLEGSWDRQLPGLSLHNDSLFVGISSKGLASVPFLSVKDQVTLHFDELRPAWFADPLPVELTADTAIWRGPLPKQETAQQEASQVIGFGMPMPQEARLEEPPREQAAAADKEELDREPMTLREFLAAFEYREAPDVLRLTSSLLISLIPYAGLLWLGRSPPLGRVEAWQSFAAATLVLAVWQSWYYFYWLATISSDVWLQRGIARVLYSIHSALMLRMEASEFSAIRQKSFEVLNSAGGNAFWLLVAVLVALVPFYFPVVARAGLPWRPSPVRTYHRSGLRRALARSRGGVRIVYGTATLTMLLLATFWVWSRSDINSSTADIYPGWLHSQSILHRLQTWLGPSLLIDRASAWLDHPVFASLLPFGLLTLFLLTLGGRAALFGLGLLAAASRLAVAHHIATGKPLGDLSALAVIGRVPWWVVLILAGLMTYPLFLRLVRVLTLFTRDRLWLHRLLAAGLIGAALGLPHLPARGMLVIGGCLLVVGIGWLIVEGLGQLAPIMSVADWAHRRPWWFIAALVVIGLVIGWPRAAPGDTLRFNNLGELAFQAASLFAYVLALGLILFMWDHAGRRPSVILDQPTLGVGIYLFAVFLISTTVKWLLIPIPFLIGWVVARFWLFRPVAEMDWLRQVLDAAPPDRERLIQDVLEADEAGSQFDAVQKALTSQLEAATLTPAEYEGKLRLYKLHFAQKLALEEVAPGVDSRETVFAIGDPHVKGNVVPALKIGALLASLPFLIAIYQYFPQGRVQYPYPLADLLVFLIQAAAFWLLLAFFFGYYFAHLRGRSGLAKGGYLFLGVSLPFAVYRVLGAQSLDEMRPFILWVAQLFLFCSLMGLFAADSRILRQNGFGVRAIKAVHHLPALSVYASSVIAAVVPTILTLLTGRLNDLVAFFLKTVLPGVPTGGQ
jgi:hypothetical protein